MPEIVQKLGFDAADALDTLKRLDNALESLQSRFQNLGTTLADFNKVGDAARKVGDAFQSGMGKAASETTKLGNSVRQNMPDAINQTGRLTTSLELLSRVVFTQLIVRGLNQIRRALNDTAQAAIDFQKQVALITTIGDGAQFGQIADQVRRLSDEFNLPLLQTAQGVYQALSNQVGDFGESVKFTEEAARFAKATNSSLADSVDLLSGALKSFSIDARDTDRVASIFFTAIDKGRVTADALANAFGRVGPVASAAGVSIEETAAAIAAVSQKGSNTAESLTQLRGVISSFLKPTPALSQALNDLGFSSSEVALRTLGFSETLRQVTNSAGGSNEVLAKMFPNVRALNGVVSLTGDEMKTLAGIIDEATNSARTFNKEKFLQATATDAERVTAEINKLKNELTIGLGQATLSVTDDLFKLTGGADNLIAAGKTATPVVLGFAGAMLTLKAATVAQNAELGLLSKGLTALALIPLAAGLGASIRSAIEDQRQDVLFKDLKALEAQDKEFLGQFTANQKERRDAANQADQERLQSALALTRDLNKQYLADVANAKSAAEQKAALAKFEKGTPFNERELEVLTGKPLGFFQSGDDVQRGLIEAQQQAEELRAKVDAAVAGEQGIARLEGNLDELFGKLDQLETSRAFAIGEPGKQLRDQFAGLLEELRKVREDGRLTVDELLSVEEMRNKLGKAVFNGGDFLTTFNQKETFGSTLNTLDTLLAKMLALSQLQGQTGDSATLQTELAALESFLQQAAPAEQRFASVAQSIASGVDPARSIAAAFITAADNAERMARAASGTGSAQGKALGGLTYLAAGGEAKGTDTISAMLSPGEFVTKASSAARFLPQLMAINAGQTPSFSRGESVTNNIGDIAINVHAAQNPQLTGEAILKVINRSQRRGTGKLR